MGKSLNYMKKYSVLNALPSWPLSETISQLRITYNRIDLDFHQLKSYVFIIIYILRV